MVALALVAAYLFIYRGMRFFTVPSGSMQPTLQRGDYIGSLREKTYRRGDLVVAREPGTGDYIVKRIAGMPGDVLMTLDGALFINGHYASEPYLRELIHYQMPEVAVPEGEVFLLGDNRNESEDSADTGEGAPIEDIVGRVRFIYYPYNRMGPVRSYPLINAAGE